MQEHLLIVDDDKSIHMAIKMALYNEAYRVSACDTLAQAFLLIQKDKPDLVILDVHFPEGSGLQLLEQLHNSNCQVPILLISGAATAAEAVRGIKLGAYDYLEKPISADRLRLSISRCLAFHKQQAMVDGLTKPYNKQTNLIGSSEPMQALKKQIALLAPENIRVLITGETGTGKEVVAQTLWQNSKRQNQAYVVVNSAAIPEALIESELFGHKKGSFTGALSDRSGKIELADQGTLFLDEIGDLTLAAQAKLLRFLENHEVQRVGDGQIRKFDVRVIAATSKHLELEVEKGRFRADLFYRLNVARIKLPKLCEHRDDIPELVNHFLHNQNNKTLQQQIEIEADAIAELKTYSWPGNVRQLRNFLEMIQMSETQYFTKNIIANLLRNFGVQPMLTEIPTESTANDIAGDFVSLKQFKNNAEKAYIEKVLESVSGSVSKAARILEIDRSYLHQKMNNLNLEGR